MPNDNSGSSPSGFGRWVHLFLYSEGWISWVRSLVFAFALVMVFRWAIAEPYSIPSGSMEPTLHGDPRFLRGDRVFVNKWIYGIRYPFMNKRIWQGKLPERWDIVVFKASEENALHNTLVKRVVALPGERVNIGNDGKIYINGEAVPVPPSVGNFEYSRNIGAGFDYGVRESDTYSLVPEGHYLVLGDNSNHSRDGRRFGWLPNENIVGRAACIWWPIGNIRDFTGFTETLWWRTSMSLLALYVFWRMFFGRSWRVLGRELGDDFAPSAHLYINRLSFGIPVPSTRMRLTQGRQPARGETVAYYAKVDNGLVVLAGRIAGIPGDKVAVKNGQLFVADEVIEAPGASNGEDDSQDKKKSKNKKRKRLAIAPGPVPEGNYVILSNDSEVLPDSRALGCVDHRDLIGPATAIWWPPSKWGRVRA
jgi:signal peptidase I